jgi:hypothetical protein
MAGAATRPRGERLSLFVSWAALLACGAPQPAPDPADWLARHEAVARLQSQRPDRDQLWTTLADFFAGPELTRAYREHYVRQHRMAQEGTRIQVQRVSYDHVAVLPDASGGYLLEVTWNVGGVVTHQQHQHTRVNRYDAAYQLAGAPAGWRVVATHLRAAERRGDVLAGAGESWLLDLLPETDAGTLSAADLLEAELNP